MRKDIARECGRQDQTKDDTMIELSGLTYCYPGQETPALKDVSLTVAPGEFVLLAGPSGAGKSTLLRILNGLAPHFTGGRVSGKATVAGLNPIVGGPPLLSRKVGFVFQNPEAQTVLENVEMEIAFGLENLAMSPDQMRLRVEEVLDLLELSPLRHRLVQELSGGERQRMAIAAVLAMQPPILALDEPTSQLDPKSAEDLLQTLVRLNDDLGLTILLAEHRLERVIRYAERVVYLRSGRVLLDGPTEEILPEIPQLSPVAELGRQLGWKPIPLTVKDGHRFARRYKLPANGRPKTATRPNEIVLEVRQGHFSYGSKPILRELDLQVSSGEVVALMGRNGSGKTTLLRCIVGLLSIGKGEIFVNGRSIRGLTVAEICRDVGYLPQNPDDLLYADSVREELATTLANHGARGNGIAGDRIPALLEELGLQSHVNAYPRDLSVGQRQRVALGAVAVNRPRLLLLDEPTRGLDSGAKRSLVKLWQRWKESGQGIVLVTHDVELAAQVADRVVVMSEGEIIVAGPTAEVMSASPLFSSQIARLFPGQGWLTVSDALAGLKQNGSYS